LRPGLLAFEVLAADRVSLAEVDPLAARGLVVGCSRAVPGSDWVAFYVNTRRGWSVTTMARVVSYPSYRSVSLTSLLAGSRPALVGTGLIYVFLTQAPGPL